MPIFRTEIPLARGQAGAVIGVSGANVKAIRASTGANIRVSRRGRTEYAVIEAPSDEAGRAAEAAVREAAATAQPPPPRVGGAGNVTRARVPASAAAAEGHAHKKRFGISDASLVAVVLGPKGATVRALEAETGAAIIAEKETPGFLIVSGGSDDIVNAAIARIQTHIAGYVKCGSGATCGGWALKGELFCPRCARASRDGEAADTSRPVDSRKVHAADRSRRERGRDAARSAKQQVQQQ